MWYERWWSGEGRLGSVKRVLAYGASNWRGLSAGVPLGLLASSIVFDFPVRVSPAVDLFVSITVAQAITIVGLGGSSVAWLVRLSFERQAGKRLDADTAIRAVDLMTEDAPPERRAGALLALTQLGHIEFALELLRELWAAGSIELGSALWVIEQGLDSGDKNTEAQAALMFRSNASRCVVDDIGLMPRQMTSGQWPVGIDRAARHALLHGVARMAGAFSEGKRRTEWPGVMELVDTVLSNDPDALIKTDAGLLLETLLVKSGIKGDAAITSGHGELLDRANELKTTTTASSTQQMFDAMAGYTSFGVALGWMGQRSAAELSDQLGDHTPS